MYRIITIVLLSILSLSLMNVAFAKEVSNYGERSITAEPEGIALQVDSQEELEALVQEIKEGNERVDKMWEATYFFNPNEKIALILCYKTSETGGIKRFTDVYDLLVIPHNDSGTNISNIYWQYEYLDTKRTVAVNTSFIVSIKNLSGGYNNYDVTKYVEYYAAGGANAW